MIILFSDSEPRTAFFFLVAPQHHRSRDRAVPRNVRFKLSIIEPTELPRGFFFFFFQRIHKHRAAAGALLAGSGLCNR